MDRYLLEARPQLLYGPGTEALFLSKEGGRISLVQLSKVVRGYIRRADLGKDGSCHLFRHTAATLMLENGADIRYVQEMVGHKRIETTQTYTRVSITKLAEIHAATHPGAQIFQPSQGSTRPDPDSLEAG